MVNKVLMIIMDGLGDRPIKEFEDKTPLEKACTPNFNKIVQKSQCGLMSSLGKFIRPGSDTAHLAILGYDINTYYSGRGPIEVSGIGMDLHEGDIAFRGNFGTVDDNLNITDRRAGRITEVSEFAKALDGIIIDGIEFIVKPAVAHRAGVIMRGKGLSSNITDNDPHVVGEKVRKVIPTDNSKEAIFTANVLNKFMKQSYDILKNLEANKIRKQEGKLEANFLLLRGAGTYPQGMQKFNTKYGFNKSACVAGGGLYKGIGAFLGMDIINVDGATALPNTNIDNKIETTIDLLNNKNYDFVFLHIKPTDSLAEDGNYLGKKDFIEKVDKSIQKLETLNDDVLIIITSDHSTACELKAHSADPVPIMFCCNGILSDDVVEFSERAFSKGGLGFIEGKDVMQLVLNILGKLPLIGA